jgi:hypothetical protein
MDENINRVVGINPKDWFYGFREHIRRRQGHTRLVLAGASCEQWLNAELMAFLSRRLRGSQYVPCGEIGKKDGGVFPIDDEGEQIDWSSPVALVEAKIISNNGIGLRRAPNKVERLVEQVLGDNKFDNQPVVRIGVLFAIYRWWPNEDEPVSFVQFRKQALDTLRRKIEAASEDNKGWKLVLDHDCMETLLDVRDVWVGGAHVDVGCAYQYFVARPQQPSA